MINYEEKCKALDIDSQIKKFLAKGGKITQCEPCTFGISSENWSHKNRSQQWKARQKNNAQN